MAIIRMRCKEFLFQTHPLLHGTFLETMRGNLLPPYHLYAYAYDAGLARILMVDVFTRQRLALSSVDSISNTRGI
jgi:hypothetical protein